MDQHDTPDPATLHEAGPPPELMPELEAASRPARPRRDPLPVLFGIGILILIGAVVFLWRHPINGLMAAAGPDEHVVALQQQVASLQERLSGLEQRPAPPPPPPPVNLAPLESRLSALEKRPQPATGDSGPAVDATARDQVAALGGKLDPLSKQIDGLARQVEAQGKQIEAQGKQLEALGRQLDGLTKQQTTLATNEGATLAALSARVDADQQRLAAMAGQAAQIAAVNGRLDAEDQRLGALTAEAGKINGVAERAARVARLQAASAALAAGRPLGELADAQGPQGSALAPFRSEPPPTEAALRLAFPEAAAAAQAASRPDTAQLPFWQAMQSRAEELVTVRRGDNVVVGDPAAGIIARARHALDAGDLAGSVAILGELTGKPAEAFAPWLQRARALLDARAALAALAARA